MIMRKVLYFSIVIVLLAVPCSLYASHGHDFAAPENDILSPCESYLIDCGYGTIEESDEADHVDDDDMKESGEEREEGSESPQEGGRQGD